MTKLGCPGPFTVKWRSNQELNKTEFDPLTSSFLVSHVSLEFLESVLLIYQDLLSGKSPNTVIVPTSASIEQLPSVAAEENEREEQQQQDGVEPFTLTECIVSLCDRFKCR